MRYFYISHDKGLSDAPVINGFHQEIDIRKLTVEYYKAVPMRTLLTVTPNKNLLFPDVHMMPVMLLSERAWEIVRTYEPHTRCREIVLLDQENEYVNVYYLPIFYRYKCAVEMHIDSTRKSTRPPILKRELIPDRSVFQIDYMNKLYTVLRLDLIESLLNRNMLGFSIKEAKME